MLSIFKMLLSLFDGKEKRQAFILLVYIVIAAFLELLSVSIFMPFMKLVIASDVYSQHKVIIDIYEYFGFSSYPNFLLVAALLVIFIIIVSNAFRAFSTWVLYDFTYMREATISKKLFQIYIDQPYSFFLTRNSSEFSKNILNEVGILVGGVIITGMLMVSRLFIILFIAGFLIYLNPIVALTIACVFAALYFPMYYFFHEKIEAMGKIRIELADKRFNAVKEGFLNVKEAKIYGIGNKFLDRYSDASEQSAKFSASQETIGKMPAYIMETVGLSVAISIIAYNLVYRNSSFIDIIPLLSVYIFSGYRLLPNVQQVFSNLARIHFTIPVLKELSREFKLQKTLLSNNARLTDDLKTSQNIISAGATAIKFEDVTFKYDTADKDSLVSINLDIHPKTVTAIVGATGAGKTTLIDLILGLLIPTAGKISFDGKTIDEIGDAEWFKNFAYVSQTVSLFDASIAENIALDSQNIDYQKIDDILEIVELKEMITNLSQGSYTAVGENGVRLSGGQKQRLSIARALYHGANLLVLDEATSALDTMTEGRILERLCRDLNKTIVLITHRPAVMEYCDEIIIIENGKISDRGNYNSLKQRSSFINAMTGDKNMNENLENKI